MNRSEILQVLEAGDFAALMGVHEDVEVEFKGQPYQLEEEHQRFELAKDVSALANVDGGVIVVGIRTERTVDAPVDRAAEVRLLTRGLVNEQQYVGVITERIYPRIQNIRVEFVPSEDDVDRGLVLIDVPPQAHVEKLFLVQKPVSPDTNAPGWMIGVAIRSVGRVEERRVGEIHTLINRGFTISNRLDELVDEVGLIRERLDAGRPPEVPESPSDRLPDVLNDRIAELESPIEDA